MWPKWKSQRDRSAGETFEWRFFFFFSSFTFCLTVFEMILSTHFDTFPLLQFICEEGAGDYIARVDEPQSCRYVLTVHTSRTCQHPFLRPPSTAKPQGIVCQPALSAQQYMDYVKAQVCEFTKLKVSVMQHRKGIWSRILRQDIIYIGKGKEKCDF